MEELNQELATLEATLSKVTSEHELNELKSKYLGKKSVMMSFYKQMRDLSDADKKSYGKQLNEYKNTVMNLIEAKKCDILSEILNKQLSEERIDVTLPGIKSSNGTTNVLMRVVEDVENLFISMGYDVVEGPEVETDENNFEKLNLPKGHPARDMQDSFYIDETLLLRTHTSPVQVRAMLANEDKTPMRIICPGKVYRRDDDDATHSHQFNQIEGLVIDRDISIANLKGTLELFAKHLFGADRKIRLRPNYFPFTEPSYEVDVTCFNCDHDPKCKICRGTGWIELLGSGMVHPNVLRMSGYDPEEYSGFAFGMGTERIAMLKYGIKDVRDLYTNDLRNLLQYNRMEVANNENK